MVVANIKINDDKKYTTNASNFYHHADAAVQCRVHRPMAHIPGFTRSNWMLSAGGTCAVLLQWPPWLATSLQNRTHKQKMLC
jgi:hypothetical protein